MQKAWISKSDTDLKHEAGRLHRQTVPGAIAITFGDFFAPLLSSHQVMNHKRTLEVADFYALATNKSIKNLSITHVFLRSLAHFQCTKCSLARSIHIFSSIFHNLFRYFGLVDLWLARNERQSKCLLLFGFFFVLRTQFNFSKAGFCLLSLFSVHHQNLMHV